MDKFEIERVSCNAERNMIYLKSPENNVISFSLITKKILYNNKPARRSHLLSIATPIRKFEYKNTNIIYETNEIWLYMYMRSAAMSINSLRNTYLGRKKEKFSNFFVSLDIKEYPVTPFEAFSDVIEKVAKSGMIFNLYANTSFRYQHIDPKEYVVTFNKLLPKVNPYDPIIDTIHWEENRFLYNFYNSIQKKLNEVFPEIHTFIKLVLEKVNTRSITGQLWWVDNILNVYSLPSLFTDYKYTAQKLFNYIEEEVRWQGLKPFTSKDRYERLNTSTIELLYDYARISHMIRRDLEFNKYPKYIKVSHDIVSLNYEIKKDEIVSTNFKRVCEKYNHLGGYSNTEYCTVIPEETDELTKEGVCLSHCVGSYITDVAEDKTFVFFIRDKKEKEKSLLTVELKDQEIKQVKGFANRGPTEKEVLFINDFASKFDIKSKYVV